MHRIDPGRTDLAHEFKANPLGPHSPDLQKLLKLLRWEPIAGRFVVVQPERAGPWFLARTTGPKGHPFEVFWTRRFDTLTEAHWAVFRKRWEAHTGVPLVLDDGDQDDPAPGDGELERELAERPLLGYADRFSVENGGRIEFKVSSTLDGPYRAQLVRLRSADHAGLGLKQTPIASPIDGEHAGRFQATVAGSWIDVPGTAQWKLESFTLQAVIWPTTPARRPQALFGPWCSTSGRGYGLVIDEAGAVALLLGDGETRASLGTGVALRERHWYTVAASFDAATGDAWIVQRAHRRYARDDTTAEAHARLDIVPAPTGPLRIAAWCEETFPPAEGEAPAGGFYNGKLEEPMVARRALAPAERESILATGAPAPLDDAVVARWDFGRDISGTRVVDVSPNRHHGRTVNLPTRAMKGWRWDGSEYDWTRRPEHYGAIHFHDDDLYDCGWKTDFALDVPEDLASGLYAAYLTRGAHEDWIPFVVRPPRGTVRAPLALLLPTTSYWAYANRHSDVEWREREQVRGVFSGVDSTGLYLHAHPELGCSMYDEHSDGSGVCLSSRLRPILNMRPKEALWQLPADTHLVDWLDELGFDYDVITEDDLDAEGQALLAPYRCVMTGTHPEYPSKRELDAIAAYQEAGGRFVYMGGNGFYWRVSFHPDLPGVMEMRRAEDGIRSWLAEGGEYYHAFTGELGGMWRRMGRAPQSVAGTGMTAQGFDRSTFYVRTPASFDPRAAFIFEGVGEDERIGDFGLVGGGAAGWEIDRADPALGTPPHALVVATASDFTASYHWMKEELTHTHSAITGETCPHVRCDMVFYETPNGGAVFSTSSIAWAGALAHDGYDNNVSRITANVLRRFLDPESF